MREYWEDTVSPKTNEESGTTNDTADSAIDSLASEFERHRRMLLEKASSSGSNLGWAAELRRYLDDLPHDVSKNMDIIVWWAKNGIVYPTLARIAQDICAIPASSVPCERLFSAGAEIATDRRSCLGADRFEELQILKHAWHSGMVDRAGSNSAEIEEVYLQDFKDLHKTDEDLARYDEDIVEVDSLNV